jgi:hypothetical protein
MMSMTVVAVLMASPCVAFPHRIGSAMEACRAGLTLKKSKPAIGVREP